MKKEIHPWSYVLQKNGNRIFHVTDTGLNPIPEQPEIAVATFEYTRPNSAERYSKNGIKKPWDPTGSENIRTTSQTFDHRQLPTVNLEEESVVVRPTEFLYMLLNKEITGNHPIPVTALEYFVSALNYSDEQIANIGIEGSLCIGQANSESDLDLLIYGYQNYLDIISRLQELFKTDSNIIPLANFDYGRNELIQRRKDHSPFNIAELLYVTERRPYFYIKQVLADGVVVYTKVSLFGVVNKEDGNYRTELDVYLNPIEVTKLGVVTISGQVTDATLGITIPSVWKIAAQHRGKNVDYIVDYAGIFPEHIQTGEFFEARGTLEEYIDASGNSGYRLVIAYWDQHVKNNMYVKPILNK